MTILTTDELQPGDNVGGGYIVQAIRPTPEFYRSWVWFTNGYAAEFPADAKWEAS